jgi:hypothetical protein
VTLELVGNLKTYIFGSLGITDDFLLFSFVLERDLSLGEVVLSCTLRDLLNGLGGICDEVVVELVTILEWVECVLHKLILNSLGSATLLQSSICINQLIIIFVFNLMK